MCISYPNRVSEVPLQNPKPSILPYKLYLRDVSTKNMGMENDQTCQSDTSLGLRRTNAQWEKCVYLLYTIGIQTSTKKSKTLYSSL